IALKAAEYSENPGLYMLHKAAHGAVGGGISEAQGGEFAHGFASSFTAKTAGGALNGALEGLGDTARAVWGTVGTAIVGGTVAEVGGGKFANGATTAAVQHIFNQLTTQMGKKSVLVVHVESGPDDEVGPILEADGEELKAEFAKDDDGFLGFGKDSILSDGDTLDFKYVSDLNQLAEAAEGYDWIIVVAHGTTKGVWQQATMYNGIKVYKTPREWLRFYERELGISNVRYTFGCNPGDGCLYVGIGLKHNKSLVGTKIREKVEPYLRD
ncbi:hypothetical protein MLD52_22905, partial [Puniceicoccaceae bacterium K14]|nr:hypothetical protein [Puniceicoccaceae bacterium K14]